MRENYKKTFYITLLLTIFFILLSILILYYPKALITTIYYTLGIITGILGIIGIIKFLLKRDDKLSKYGIVYGPIFIIVAVLLIIFKEQLSKSLPVLIGLFMIFYSIYDMKYILDLKTDENKNYKILILVMSISILLGIILIISPFKNIFAYTESIGIMLFFYGILKITSIYLIKINKKEE